MASLGDPDLPAGVLPFSKIDGLSDLQEEEEEEEEEEEGLFKADAATALPRCRRRVQDRRATLPGETHPYPSWLRYCGSKVESEEEEEGLFNANAVNEEEPERDRATPA
jgi:hypothetical protein